MFSFLKRLFGGSGPSATEPRAPMPPAARGIPPPGPAWMPPDDGDDAGDKTVLYRRDSTGRAGVSHADRHGEAVTSESPLFLAVLTGSQKGRHFMIPMNGAVLGRSRECDIVLSDTHVSARHAWVGVVDGVAMIRDIGSTNGTFLNASSQSLQEDTPLSANDTIMLGGHYGLQLRVVHAKDAPLS